jgi:lipoprotein NlpI
VKYRLHGNNVTFNNQRLWFRERIVLRKSFLEKYSAQISRRLKADIYYKIGHAYGGLGEKAAARRFYLKALAACPFRAESLLYLILALTDGDGMLGRCLESSYRNLSSRFSN